ncbi:hypothetical protein [Amycolatopsis sp. NPDC051102]|uniref:hypothetical protein n=1 Tax=Amycolatopsis sp. NPDC051102 TaxID=3155163 RepID=UPI003449F96E
MRITGVAGLFVLCSVSLVACAPGDTETDRVAKRVAEAIGSPPQNSAAGYARKALETNFGRGPNFAVLELRDTPSDDLEATTVHLVFRVHHDGSQDEWFPQKPVTACYDVGYNFRGLVEEPSRRDCPAGATPVNPPPIPRWDVPEGFDPALQSVLTGLPAAATENDVRAALARSIPAPRAFNPDTQTADRAPLQDIALRGTDVGVAYRAGDRSTGGIDCLLGSRVNGATLVWRPSWAQVQPGELTCTGQTALDRQGTTPPH